MNLKLAKSNESSLHSRSSSARGPPILVEQTIEDF